MNLRFKLRLDNSIQSVMMDATEIYVFQIVMIDLGKFVQNVNIQYNVKTGVENLSTESTHVFSI